MPDGAAEMLQRGEAALGKDSPSKILFKNDLNNLITIVNRLLETKQYSRFNAYLQKNTASYQSNSLQSPGMLPWESKLSLSTI